MGFDVITSIAASVVAGLFSVVAALVAQLISRRRKKEAELSKDQVGKIAAAVQSEQSARAATIIEKVTGKIPPRASQKQLSLLIEDLKATLSSSIRDSASTSLTAVENLVKNYHEQALSQAMTQFWFSIGAATIGFIWILFYGASIQPEHLESATRILPGIVMDAVAFLFFRQAAETRQRATDLYDRLRMDRQNTESIALVSSIEDIRVRSAVKAQIALHMSGLLPNPIDLSSFIGRERKADTEDQRQAT